MTKNCPNCQHSLDQHSNFIGFLHCMRCSCTFDVEESVQFGYKKAVFQNGKVVELTK